MSELLTQPPPIESASELLDPNLVQLDQFPVLDEDPLMTEYGGIIDKIPDESERHDFLAGIAGLPDELKEAYFKRMGHTFNEKDPVTAHSGRNGIMYELNRIQTVRDAGLETVDFDAGSSIGEVTYRGYSKNADINGEPDVELSSEVDCDIPLSRNGKPYVYEVKSYARMEYGSKPNSKNQVLKYEQAVSSGVADGASVELKGRIDPNFLKWASGDPEVGSPIPNVEILYTVALPSGKEFTVILKPGPEGKGLKYANPETEDELDKQVIAGLKSAEADGSIGQLIAEKSTEIAPDEMKPYVENPFSIKTVDVMNEYEGIQRAALYEKVLAKAA